MTELQDRGNAYDVMLPMAGSAPTKRHIRGYELFKSDMKDWIDRFNWRRLPFLTLGMVAFMCYLNLYYAVGREPKSGGVMIFSPCKRHQHWRYITYSFLHADGSHLMGNVYLLLLFGAPLEYFHKWWRLGLVYFFGAAAGALVKIIAYPDSFSAGASNANAALMMACLVSVVMKWNDDPYHRAFCFAWVCETYFLISTNIAAQFSDSPSSVAHWSHLCGMFSGLLLGLYLFHDKKSRLQVTIARFAMSFFVIMISGLLICNMFFSKKFQDDFTRDLCKLINRILD